METAAVILERKRMLAPTLKEQPPWEKVQHATLCGIESETFVWNNHLVNDFLYRTPIMYTVIDSCNLIVKERKASSSCACLIVMNLTIYGNQGISNRHRRLERCEK